MHGVIVMKDHPVVVKSDSVGVEYVQPLQNTGEGPSRFQHVSPNSLESIMRTFKAAVTRETRKCKIVQHSIWQRSFHDHIIRDDIDHFLVEQYIELNPILWSLRSVERLTDTIYLVSGPTPKDVKPYDILHCCPKKA